MNNLQKEYVKYMVPILGNYLIWGIGYTMYAVILGHMGSDVVAASSLTESVRNLLCFVITGLNFCIGVIVGQELGAGKLQKAKEYGDKLIRICIICGVFSAALMVASIPVVLRIVDLTPQARKYLVWMLPIGALSLVAKACSTCTEIFNVGGEPKFPLRCSTVSMWCITLPLAALAAFALKLPVLMVFFLLYMDDAIKAPVLLGHYRKYRWLKNLTEEKKS